MLKRGPGTWKFNNTLFEDQDYIDLINFIYPRTLEIYKDVQRKQLLSELIKIELRAKTISLSGASHEGRDSYVSSYLLTLPGRRSRVSNYLTATRREKRLFLFTEKRSCFVYSGCSRRPLPVKFKGTVFLYTIFHIDVKVSQIKFSKAN